MYIYSLPFIAAIIGWFTNYLAVKMLFRPRKKKKFLFIEIQGIFPKRQAKLAERIAKMVADELLSASDIKEKINNPEVLEMLHTNIEDKIDDYLNNKFSKQHPIFNLFLGKKGKQQIKSGFLTEVQEVTPYLIGNYMDKIEDTLDVEETIRQKVAVLSPAKLEDLIMSILKKEFHFIELIGAVIGFLIGVVQVILVKI
ncbi:MAG: DUF445 domain-containing protein [Flavobacteriales bacterium]|nr:DUF445 family protein [Bacteroidales bacterium AH-315-I05]PCJ86357.1 MAG: DUF445 domain-containing protein [Flavobacteriales bacterium]